MRHVGNNTNFERLLKLVFTSFSTKNIMDTIEEGVLNALVRSAPNLQKLEICYFGNKPFIYVWTYVYRFFLVLTNRPTTVCKKCYTFLNPLRNQYFHSMAKK